MIQGLDSRLIIANGVRLVDTSILGMELRAAWKGHLCKDDSLDRPTYFGGELLYGYGLVASRPRSWCCHSSPSA